MKDHSKLVLEILTLCLLRYSLAGKVVLQLLVSVKKVKQCSDKRKICKYGSSGML